MFEIFARGLPVQLPDFFLPVALLLLQGQTLMHLLPLLVAAAGQ